MVARMPLLLRCLVLFWSLLPIAQASAQVHPTDLEPFAETKADRGETAATLIIRERDIFTFRDYLFGLSPGERMVAARDRIMGYVASGAPCIVGTRAEPQGVMITLDGRGVFAITTGDLDPLDKVTPAEAAERVVAALRPEVVAELEDRTVRGITTATGVSIGATAALIVCFWIIQRVGSWLSLRLALWATLRASSLGATPTTYRRSISDVSKRAIEAFSWLMRLLLICVWLTFVLGQFPWTRPLGDYFEEYLILARRSVLHEAATAVPDILVIITVFYVVRFLTQIVNLTFASISERRTKVTWLDPSMASTTRRVILCLIWLLAVIMVYPYVPGSNTQAFRAIGVFAGLLLSLGSSSVMNQIASGLLLVYSKTIRPGEYIRVGETEGTVTRIGLVNTRICSYRNEDVTLPNTSLLGSTMVNFTRESAANAILHTSVSIGYGTPWRQVHEMLKMAASRTSGLQEEPSPYVWQRALSDFYVQYELNAFIGKPQDRIKVLADLHANIQDVFNEYGVQIMSPHYLTDPAKTVIVPPPQWHLPPAQAPDDANPQQAGGAKR